MLVTCVDSYCDNDYDEESGTSDQEHTGERVNRSRYVSIGRLYDIGNENNDKDYHNNDNDDENVDSTHKLRKIRICDNERRRQRRKLAGNRRKQWSKKTDKINQFIGSFILLVSTMRVSLACPEIITSICHCDDSQNGIILQCSHTDGSQVVYMLRANQINLDIDENSFLGMNNILQELILHHNNLTQLPSKALAPLSALLRLDLSNNSIGDIEAQHAFPPLSKLYDVSLANNHICQIHKNAFDDVKYNIQTINLGRNCLKEVPAPAIRGFKQLMALHLHNNNINSLGALSFMNLPLINLLNLASNQISTIHKQTFLNVPNLRYLYLTRNRITNILPYQFSSFEQLEMLDLTGNYLTELRENSFSNLKNLRQLYLGENRIAIIKPDSFANSSVVILILNSNRLVELQSGMFDGLTKLQQLALRDNQDSLLCIGALHIDTFCLYESPHLIWSIDRNSFYSNPSLAMLDLSNNELVDIPPSTFFAQINLFFIDLSNNKLVRTPYGAFNRRVKTVLLQENPLVCSERVHMLQQGVGIYIASSEDIICGQHYNQNSIENITNTTNMLTTSNYFTMDHGEETNFKQEEKSKPPPVIRPLSVIDNDVNKSKADVDKQRKIDATKVISVRPVHAPVNVQSTLSLQSTEMLSTEQFIDATRNRASTILEFQNYATKRYEDGNRNRSEYHQHRFDTTNIIHPFPVPFLKRPPKLSESYIVESGTIRATNPTAANNRTFNEQTLPPSIVVANHIQGSDYTTSTRISQVGKNSMEIIKKAQESEEEIFLIWIIRKGELERVTTPSVIILICLSTVAIVMAAVLIGLCIVKHRRLQTYQGSMTTDSVARTNAYVTAQLDMIYGTVRRDRNASILNRLDDGQPWIYAPTSYGSTELRTVYVQKYYCTKFCVSQNSTDRRIGKNKQSIDDGLDLTTLRRWLMVLNSLDVSHKRVILLFYIFTNYAFAFCPAFLKNQTTCSCFAYIDGVVIRCSGQNGPAVVEQLKKTPIEIRELALENANIVESICATQIGRNAFRNLRIKKLILDNNRIRALHPQAFRGLESVMLELSISKNKLSAIPTDSLIAMRALRVLSLRCNNIGDIRDQYSRICRICNIEGSVFNDVKETLQNLILDNNCLSAVPSEALKGLDNLIGLHMKYNEIKQLESKQLTNLSSLTILSLIGNKISTIESNFMPQAENLRYLYLGNNNLETIETGVLHQFKQVQVIDMSYNYFTKITSDMFSGLEHLQHLNLEGNQIKDIAPGAFATTPLLLLWLRNNCLGSVSPNLFQGTPFLRQPLSFAHLANLHTLDLSHNKIYIIEPSAIIGSDYLMVRLQENPMVCLQDGFHVMNGKEAINLTTEPNLICQTNYTNNLDDVCPKNGDAPQPPLCCLKSMPKVNKTISMLPLETKTTTASTTATTYESLNAHPNSIHSKKFNTERFMRLSQRPNGYRTSPFLRYHLPTQSEQADTALLGKNLKNETTQAERISRLDKHLEKIRAQLPPYIRIQQKDSHVDSVQEQDQKQQ
ncbi:Leucine-rich repeat-containing protein let-4 [Dirofilaria immitis]|nr:Leucine-rich repeat-containing protein let-4 [Dirofilaria immitis]